MLIKRLSFLVISLILTVTVILTVKKGDEDTLNKIVKENSGVFLSEDGYVVSLYEFHGEEAFLENFDKVSAFIKKCPLETYVAIPPRKMDALTKSLPKNFPTSPAKRLFELAKKETLKEKGVYIDLLPTLEGEDGVYFKTDHHWTSHGAYLAYREIISKMGHTPLEESYFDIKLFCDRYRGSDYTKKNVDVFDNIYLYYSENTPHFLTTQVSYPYDNDENNEVIPLYLEDRISSYDPYTVYFGGNNPYIKIELGERETLLIVRDSFASALAPFLAEHFNLVLIDPRFYPDKLSTLIERESIDKVLILENMGSYTENKIKFIY